MINPNKILIQNLHKKEFNISLLLFLMLAKSMINLCSKCFRKNKLIYLININKKNKKLPIIKKLSIKRNFYKINNKSFRDY